MLHISVSVSADLKKTISVIYRIGRFKKWDLSVYIGSADMQKNLIGRTLNEVNDWTLILTGFFP